MVDSPADVYGDVRVLSIPIQLNPEPPVHLHLTERASSRVRKSGCLEVAGKFQPRQSRHCIEWHPWYRLPQGPPPRPPLAFGADQCPYNVAPHARAAVAAPGADAHATSRTRPPNALEPTVPSGTSAVRPRSRPPRARTTRRSTISRGGRAEGTAPGSLRPMYMLARAQSLSGRPHDALVMLLRLAERGIDTDAADNDDFASVRRLPQWPDLPARLRGAAAPGTRRRRRSTPLHSAGAPSPAAAGGAPESLKASAPAGVVVQHAGCRPLRTPYACRPWPSRRSHSRTIARPAVSCSATPPAASWSSSMSGCTSSWTSCAKRRPASTTSRRSRSTRAAAISGS